MALSVYDKTYLPTAAQGIISSLQDAWAKVAGNNGLSAAEKKKQEDAIHTQAEQVRKQYGYSGGVDGSSLIRIAGQAVSTVASAAKTAVGIATGKSPAASSAAAATNVVNPTTAAGVPGGINVIPQVVPLPYVIPNTSGNVQVPNGGAVVTPTPVPVIPADNTGAIIPSPMTAQFQHVLTIFLGVVALGFVAKIFSKGRK